MLAVLDVASAAASSVQVPYSYSLSAFWTQQLERIPATFWGVLAGSLFTLIGIVLTNRANDRRLRGQLEHDLALKARERELALRKDVYLEAAVGVFSAMEYLTRFGERSSNHEYAQGEYLKKASALAKAYVVGGMEVMDAFMGLSDGISSAILVLSAARNEVVRAEVKVEALTSLLARLREQQQGTLASVRELILSGRQDDAQFEKLTKTFEFESSQIDAKQRELEDTSASLYKAQLAAFDLGIAEVAKLQKPVAATLAAVRRELGGDGDVDELTRRFERQSEINVARLREFIDKARPNSAK